tara:strand:+ start:134 stop:487 length:354 start_codon:yes stop_codon:yes gene_type:complete
MTELFSTDVYGKFEFIAFHSWPDAPPKCGFLRHPHRHKFYVKWTMAVSSETKCIDDRQIEFITKNNEIRDWVLLIIGDETEHWSCEHYAQAICKQFKCTSVDVSEDNENGAVVYDLN